MSTADGSDSTDLRGLTARWSSLSPMLDRLLDTPAEHRNVVLDELAAGDAARRVELVQLLRECETDAPLLDGAVADSFGSLLTAGSTAPLPALLGDRYRIEREIGRGGMALVYLAHDLRHARDVAVKVLRHDLAASLGAERFLREISICARLRHPNIVPLFDSGEEAGQLYYVMPYERGASLRARIESAPCVPLEEALGILRDIARALEYAHGEGVVHRDIKPENVMLSAGAAIVTDFGIAKAISASQTPESALVTHAGASIGTPAYMAPEQAAGDPTTDHRADLYAFGCLAYELLTGRRAYEEMAASGGTLPTVREVRPEVSVVVSDLIAQCLARIPADRPRDAAVVRAALASNGEASRNGNGEGSIAVAPRKDATRRTLLAGMATVSLIAVGTWALTRDTTTTTTPGATTGRTLIVLPMENDAGDSLAYLASGLAEDIARRLEGIGGLTIRSGARSEWPAATRRDINAIGRAFGATIVLRTRLVRSNDSLGIETEVANVATGTRREVRTHHFAKDRVAAAPSVVSASIAGALFQAPNPPMPKEPRHRIDDESYRLTHLAWWIGLEPIDSARKLLQAAIQLDPLNARAYAGLSATWAKAGNNGTVPFDEAYRNSTAAARQALALDPTEGSAMAQLAVMEMFQSRSLAVGLEWLAKAKRADPANSEVFLLEAMLFRMAGQYDKALDAVRVSGELDPLNASRRDMLGSILLCADRTQEALQHFETWGRSEPGHPGVVSGLRRTLAYQGKYDEAIAAWRRGTPPADTALSTRLQRAQGRQGYWDVMHWRNRRDIEAAARRRARELKGFPLVIQLAQIGEIDRSLDVLEQEVRKNSPILLRRLSCAPTFDEMRDDLRFMKLRAQVGLLH